jgi:hypothetical protein
LPRCSLNNAGAQDFGSVPIREAALEGIVQFEVLATVGPEGPAPFLELIAPYWETTHDFNRSRKSKMNELAQILGICGLVGSTSLG